MVKKNSTYLIKKILLQTSWKRGNTMYRCAKTKLLWHNMNIFFLKGILLLISVDATRDEWRFRVVFFFNLRSIFRNTKNVLFCKISKRKNADHTFKSSCYFIHLTIFWYHWVRVLCFLSHTWTLRTYVTWTTMLCP